MGTIAGNFSNAQIVDFVWPDHFDAEDQPPLIRAFGEMMGVSQLSGDIGYAVTRDRVAQDEDENWDTRTAFGDSVEAKPMRPSSDSYTLEQKRQESFAITDQRRYQIEQIVGSDNPVDIGEFVGDAIRYQIWTDYHRDGRALLADTSINRSVSASNAWTTSSGKPTSDIHSAEDETAGQATIAVMGLDVVRALQFSDPVREWGGAAIDGTDAAVEPELVEEWLAAIFGFSKLVVPEFYFNGDNYRQGSFTPVRPFDGLAWIGSPSAMSNIEQDNPEPKAEAHRPPGDGEEEWFGTRTMEPHRVGDDALGCVITGVV